MKVQNSCWLFLLVISCSLLSLFNISIIKALVISSRDELARGESPDHYNRFVRTGVERLQAQRVARVTEALSPSYGRLLSQSHARVSANKLSWLLETVRDCDSLDTVKAKLAQLTTKDTAIAVSRRRERAVSLGTVLEVERARWADKIVGRFRSVGDLRTEALAELERLEKMEADMMASPSAEFTSPTLGLSRSRTQLVLSPRAESRGPTCLAEFRYLIYLVDLNEDAVAVKLVVSAQRLSTRTRRLERLSPLESAVAAPVIAVSRRSPPISPTLPDGGDPIFRIGQMSPRSPT